MDRGSDSLIPTSIRWVLWFLGSRKDFVSWWYTLYYLHCAIRILHEYVIASRAETSENHIECQLLHAVVPAYLSSQYTKSANNTVQTVILHHSIFASP